ncbi:Lsr2 family DNA-binding protein [Amycolatopsis lurida]
MRFVQHPHRTIHAVSCGFRERSVVSGVTGESASSSSGADRERARQVREWARENGYQVSERGRISVEINEAFEEPGASRRPPRPRARVGKSWSKQRCRPRCTTSCRALPTALITLVTGRSACADLPAPLSGSSAGESRGSCSFPWGRRWQLSAPGRSLCGDRPVSRGGRTACRCRRCPGRCCACVVAGR